MSSNRYRFKLQGAADFMDQPQFATKDMALLGICPLAKATKSFIYLWDSHDTPHRCIGLATPDNEWLPPISVCRKCKGARILKGGIGICDECGGLGVKLQAPRWRPG